MEITQGAVSHIYMTKDTTMRPVLQITELKKISPPNANPNSPPRFRLAVSDGEKYQQAMLATQLNKLVSDQLIQLNCLVRLNDYICNEVQNKRIIIILNLDVVSTPPNRIGNPVPVDGPKPDPAARPGGNVGSGAPTYNNNPAKPMQPTSGGSFGGGGSWNAIPPSNAYGASMNKTEATNPYGRSASGVMTTSNSSPNKQYRPIQSINPYQNGWTIRGRCTYKSDVRKFQNARGEGQVISFELTDESGSIRITGFTEHAPKVDETVHIGRLYSVRGGTLKHANPKWNRSTSQYEMTLDRRSEFQELPDDGNMIKVKYNFTKIANLDSIEVKGTCDVLGIVQSVAPLSEIIIRSTGESCKKRSINLCDDSGAAVELTLWRNQAENFLKEEDENRHPVILIKNAMRGDFGGVCLNVSRSTALELDPVNVPEANQLRAWYDSQGGASAHMQSLTAARGSSSGKVSGERKSLEEARVEDVEPVFGGGGGGGNAMFVTRGFVSFIKSEGEISYPSDPETKKKVTPISPGIWHSASLDRQLRDDEIMHRYILNLKIADHTGSQWMSAFDESGVVVMGKTANEMRQLKDNDLSMYESVIDDAKFRPFIMRVQVREQEYKGETQIRYTMSRCEPLDFASEGRVLLEEIKNYDA